MPRSWKVEIIIEDTYQGDNVKLAYDAQSLAIDIRQSIDKYNYGLEVREIRCGLMTVANES